MVVPQTLQSSAPRLITPALETVAGVWYSRQYRYMPIRSATLSDIRGWVDLRAQLWESTSLDQHRKEAMALLSKSTNDCIVLLDVAGCAEIRAFAEASLRHDHVNGCETSPVAFLEGIFVTPEHRGAGIGRQLLEAVQSWALERGSAELASDAHLKNVASHAFHHALGFEETERVVYFRKAL